jgi:hypothetical protein
MFFALFDNYPIVTADSGAYISSGFTMNPPIDRPIFYGLFIRLTSFGASLWLTVYAQCIIFAYVLIKFLKKAIIGISNLHLLVFLLFISFFTIGGWFASQLMPDIFVAIMILAVTNYLLFTNSLTEKIALIIIIFVSVLTHNSNYVIITVFSVALILCSVFIVKLKPFIRRALILFSIGVLSWTSLCFSNYLGGNGFSSSSSTHVFIMGKLVESGVLKVYLEKACPIKNYKICNYKDNLPTLAWTFHWDASSPVQKEGGWAANKEEYNTIIADIFSRPKYYPFLAYKSVEATARQLVLTQIDGNYILPWAIFDDGTAPFEAIEQYFPHELNEFKNSKQNIKTFNIPFYDNLFFMVLIITIIFCLLFYQRIYPENKFLGSVLVIFIVLIVFNAFATAILSSVNARFNARVIWLIPFFSLILIYKMGQYFLSKVKSRLS